MLSVSIRSGGALGTVMQATQAVLSAEPHSCTFPSLLPTAFVFTVNLDYF